MQLPTHRAIKKSYHTREILAWEFWHQVGKDILYVLYRSHRNLEHWTGMVGEGDCSTTDVVFGLTATKKVLVSIRHQINAATAPRNFQSKVAVCEMVKCIFIVFSTPLEVYG